jgi:hypothetical protein
MKTKRQTFAKPAVLAVTLLGLIGLGLAAIKGNASLPVQLDDNRSLRDKAKEAGHYSEHRGYRDIAQYTDIAQITRHSEAVVVGTVQSNVVRPSSDEKSLFINYTVSVEDVIKGSVQGGETITVNIPGGKIHYADDTTAEVQTPWFKKMLNGKKYILFLDNSHGGEGYLTTGGAQGVFEIPAEGGGIKTHSGRLHDPVWQYQGMSAQDFLDLVRQTAS